jgi:MFS family permease
MFGRPFYILCAGSFLFFASFNLIVPELPALLDTLGGGSYKGLIIGLFTVSAAISRPFSGKWVDIVGRKPIILVGGLVCCLVGLIYPISVWFSSVWLLLSLRLLHGFSTGFQPTGMTSYVSDLAPASRRGEAIGIISMAGTVGMGLGPALGGYLGQFLSIQYLFLISAFMGLCSALCVMQLKETLPNPEPFSKKLFALKRQDVFESRALIPFISITFTCFIFGAILTLAPDISVRLGIENKGLFFTFMTVASVSTRFLGGKISDRIGRVPVLIIAQILLTSSALGLAYCSSAVVFLGLAVILGLGLGLNSPTLFAWAVDLASPEFKGRSISTVFLGLEIGIGCGAFLGGFLYNNDFSQIHLPFLAATTALLISLVILSIHSYRNNLLKARTVKA